MRLVSNACLSFLLLAALVWGNCWSCPQVLLSLGHAPSHDCCKHSRIDCQSVALKHFVKSDPALKAPAPAAAPQAAAAEARPQAVSVRATPIFLTLHSPPDRSILHSTFRI
jgi:hypothetical protein